MKEIEFTPGPWTISPLWGKYYGTKVQLGKHEITVWTSEYQEASVREKENGWTPDYGMDHVEDIVSYANACLIAAAPSMYEALQSFIEAVEFSLSSGDMPSRAFDVELTKARMALDRAKP
jgi:hypothetical protein